MKVKNGDWQRCPQTVVTIIIIVKCGGASRTSPNALVKDAGVLGVLSTARSV
jgi:hypothetical protein